MGRVAKTAEENAQSARDNISSGWGLGRMLKMGVTGGPGMEWEHNGLMARQQKRRKGGSGVDGSMGS